MIPQLKFKKLHPDVILPKSWTSASVGYDIHAFAISETSRRNKILLPPRNTRNIPTGLLIEPPPGYFVMVCSRSGLASQSVVVANAPGIIDPDYRGELRVLLYNGGLESHYIEHEMRIAQLFLMPVIPLDCVEVEELSQTERGDQGFGSTGDGSKKVENGPDRTTQHADGPSNSGLPKSDGSAAKS